MSLSGRSDVAVSVIVPMFDAQDTVDRAVRSCLEQTMSDLEVIVVDDGSSDDGHLVVASIDDPRVRLVSLPENTGPGGARNRGLDEARGRWITVLDADDAFLHTRLETLTEYALSGSSSRVLVDRSIVVDGAGGQALDMRSSRKATTAVKTFTAVEAIKLQIGGKPLFSRSLLEQSGARYPVGVRFGEDTAFLIQLLNCDEAELVQLPHALYKYTHRRGSLTAAPDRLDHLERAYRYLIEECALKGEILTEVHRLRERLEADRHWEAARLAFRERDYRGLVTEAAKHPSLLLRAGRAMGRRTRYRRALRRARAIDPSSETVGGS